MQIFHHGRDLKCAEMGIMSDFVTTETHLENTECLVTFLTVFLTAFPFGF